jgi:hypothetical protein
MVCTTITVMVISSLNNDVSNDVNTADTFHLMFT